ncbi:MAG: aminoacyl-tRNA hydrolase [Planctomycetes bacterium]|nr:aminoacyl-tRNA hydrolase [Planctomycetota bacterium]
MKLIVGLGNPGRKYAGTRHNVGYEVLAELARRHGQSSPKAKFQGEVVEAAIGAERALLLTPLTYMNLSGASVQPARDFYKLENSDILVVCDDFNLPLGKLRTRRKGSAGGQKGLADIIRRLGDDEVARLRIGIGSPDEHRAAADFVLSRFTADEAEAVKQTITRAADAAAVWATDGVEACMNRFNADNP